MYPAIVQIFAVGLLIYIWILRRTSLVLLLSQTSLYLKMNLSAFYSFYVSNKSGISIQSIPKNVIRFAFFLGTTFTILLEAVYIVAHVFSPEQGFTISADSALSM